MKFKKKIIVLSFSFLIVTQTHCGLFTYYLNLLGSYLIFKNMPSMLTNGINKLQTSISPHYETNPTTTILTAAAFLVCAYTLLKAKKPQPTVENLNIISFSPIDDAKDTTMDLHYTLEQSKKGRPMCVQIANSKKLILVRNIL